MYIYIYTHNTLTHLQTHTHMYIYMHTHIHVDTHTHTKINTQVIDFSNNPVPSKDLTYILYRQNYETLMHFYIYKAVWINERCRVCCSLSTVSTAQRLHALIPCGLKTLIMKM